MDQWIDGYVDDTSIFTSIDETNGIAASKASQNNYKMTQESGNASYQQQGESWN
jgi:hypothetical protein